MTHYVCTGGCHAVEDHPGVCGAESCSRKGQPFTACNCEDGQHKEAMEKDSAAVENK